jgi:putative nucleotidyltransferase with HDIG domain
LPPRHATRPSAHERGFSRASSFDGREPKRAATSDSYGDMPRLTHRTETRVLIVDDELSVRKMLAVMLTQGGFICRTAGGAEEAIRILGTEPMDAVIADLQMPEVSGMELLREVCKHYPHLVFLMATGVADVRVGVEAMQQGADDYLIKPVDLDMVLMSLDRAFHKKYLEQEVENYQKRLEEMVAQRTVELQKALDQVERTYSETLDALGAAIDLRDTETAGHSQRVGLYSLKLFRALNGTTEQLESMARGAALHDIGKLAIPDAILLKTGPLTATERRIMERHVQIGYELVRRIPFLAEATEILLMHHERWDGSGYPQGLKGTEISLGARIFAIADTLDAMTSERTYQRAISFEDACQQIARMGGSLFDKEITEVFRGFPVSTWQEIRQRTSVNQISRTLADPGVLANDSRTGSIKARIGELKAS